MKNLFPTILLVGLILFASQIAQAGELIEPGATIHKVERSLVPSLATFVRGHGYRCDTVSAAVRTSWSNAIRFVCNQNRYVYKIEDKGGQITVSLQ